MAKSNWFPSMVRHDANTFLLRIHQPLDEWLTQKNTRALKNTQFSSNARELPTRATRTECKLCAILRNGYSIRR
jgi:hypothetical protein